jgi:butyryl-CoA dehydrogenase
MRDARIAAIYEGTNGIQALDLVQRKLGLDGGQALAREIADMRAIALAVEGAADFGATAQRLFEAIDALERASAYLVASGNAALAGAAPYLKLFGLARGGACLASAGLAARKLAGEGDASQLGRITLARFFAEKIAVSAPGLAASVMSGGEVFESFDLAMAG